MIAIALLSGTGFLGRGAYAAEPKEEEVEIRCVQLEYDEAARYIIARGSVTVIWEEKTLQAELVRFYLDKKYAIAESSAALKDKNNVIRGDAIHYDYGSGTGRITNAKGFADPWFFAAKSAERQSESKYRVEGMVMTTCELERPHYTFRAKRAKIVMDKRITVYNAVLYLRNVPVFYLPFYSQGLGPHRNNLAIQPGYNSDDGLIIKTIYTYPFSERSYGKLYLDYYSKRGWGTGAEYGLNHQERVKGAIYGYHIKEQTTGSERWNLRSSYWQKLDPSWTAQGQIDFLSDTSFNNAYFQENWQRITQQLHTFGSLTRQTSLTNFRVVTERYDDYDPAAGSFAITSITLPRLSHVLYPTRGKLPFYFSMASNFQNQYTKTNGCYSLSGDVDASVTKDYRLGKKFTLKPRLGLIENWQDRASAADLADRFITRYYSNLNMRYRALRWMDWDLAHNYRLRSEINSLLIDYYADDYGEDVNSLSFTNSVYAGKLTVRNSTGYDFRHSRLNPVNDWADRIFPLVNELTWIPSRFYSAYFRESGGITPFSIDSVQSDMRVSWVDDRYLSLGAFYQSARPEDLDVNAGFGFWANDKTRLEYNMHSSIADRFNAFRFNDQEFRVYRDLHCWEIKLAYRRRQSADELTVQLELKGSGINRRKIARAANEKEFYPWRDPAKY